MRLMLLPLVCCAVGILGCPVAAEEVSAGTSAGGDGDGGGRAVIAHPVDSSWTFAKDTVGDLGSLLTAPARFDATDWAVLGGVVGGTALVGALWDNHARDEVQEHRSRRTDAFATNANNAGAIYSVAPLLAFGAVSFIIDDRDHHAWRVLRDGAETIIIASGLITPTLKYVSGRERPDSDLDSNEDWKPFSGNASFPSGHATQAFAVASVIAAEYRREWWVAPIAYAAAASVGWARMNDNKHYLSDVLAGGAIGTTVGWYVVLREDGRSRDRGVAVHPVVGQDGSAVEIAWRF